MAFSAQQMPTVKMATVVVILATLVMALLCAITKVRDLRDPYAQIIRPLHNLPIFIEITPM